MKKPGLWKQILIATLLLLLLAILLFLAWASNTSDADAKKLNEFFDQNANSAMVNEYPSHWEIGPKTDDCAYCGSSARGTNLKVISVHGSEDGVLTPQKLADNDKNLPDSLKDFVISGMNHAQAGNHGDQAGDKAATKSDEDVKMEIVAILKDEL